MKFYRNFYDEPVTVACIKSASVYPSSCFNINNTRCGSLFCFRNEGLNSCWISGLFLNGKPPASPTLLCRVSKLKLHCVINKLLEKHLSIEQCVILIGHIKGARFRACAQRSYGPGAQAYISMSPSIHFDLSLVWYLARALFQGCPRRSNWPMLFKHIHRWWTVCLQWKWADTYMSVEVNHWLPWQVHEMFLKGSYAMWGNHLVKRLN